MIVTTIRRTMIALLVFIVSLTFSTANARIPDGAMRGEPHFSDGRWRLYLAPHIAYTLTSAGLSGSANWWGSGTGHFTVRDGAIDPSNEWNTTGGGSGRLTVPGGAGTIEGEFEMGGKVVGSALDAKLAGSSTISGSIQAVVQDAPIEFPINISQELSPSPRLTIYSASCDAVSGNFTVEYEAIAAANGLNPIGQGTFTAVRVAEPGAGEESSDPFSRKVLRLLGDAAMLADSARAGEIQTEPILDLLERAQEIQREMPTARGECRTGLPWYSNAIGPALYELLTAISERANELPADKLAHLISAGYQSGALGADTPESKDLESKYQEAFDQVLDKAIEDGDIEALESLKVSADQNGWTDAAEKASDALSELTR